MSDLRRSRLESPAKTSRCSCTRRSRRSQPAAAPRDRWHDLAQWLGRRAGRWSVAFRTTTQWSSSGKTASSARAAQNWRCPLHTARGRRCSDRWTRKYSATCGRRSRARGRSSSGCRTARSRSSARGRARARCAAKRRPSERDDRGLWSRRCRSRRATRRRRRRRRRRRSPGRTRTSKPSSVGAVPFSAPCRPTVETLQMSSRGRVISASLRR